MTGPKFYVNSSFMLNPFMLVEFQSLNKIQYDITRNLRYTRTEKDSQIIIKINLIIYYLQKFVCACLPDSVFLYFQFYIFFDTRLSDRAVLLLIYS